MNMRCLCFLSALAVVPLSALAAASQSSAPTVALTQKQAEQFIRVAQRLSAQGDYKNAVGFYQRALNVEPNNVEGISGMGDAMVGAGLALDATILYNQLMMLRPSDMRGPLGLARAYNRAGQPARGLEWVNFAIGKGATGIMPALEKGLALDLLGQPKDAQAVYAEGIKQAPNSIDLLKNMALSLALTEDYAASLQLLQKISNEPGMIAQVREALATVYALSGQADQSMKIVSGAALKPEELPAKAAYYAALSRLDMAGKAKAAHLGLANEESHAGATPDLPKTALSSMPPAPPLGVVTSGDLASQAPPQPLSLPAEKPHKPGKPQMITLPVDPADTTSAALSNPIESSATGAMSSAGASAGASAIVRASPVAAGDHVWVQLGSSPLRSKLEQQWQWAFLHAQGGLSGLAPYIQPYVLNGKTVLRLVVGGYADGSTAVALIKRLRALKIPGFVNKNLLGADPLYP